MNSEPAAAPLVTGSQSTLMATLLVRCTFPPPGSAVRCALSGGPDSTALVALAAAADLRVEAMHIDHGLRPDSATDAEVAAATAQQLGVEFRCERISLDDGPNLEARARRARRDAMGTEALTGHTADDQAETLLLNLLRGAGTTGLAAMRSGSTKPILALRRAETHRLCELLDLDVALDPSNAAPRFRRNRVRHELLPLLDDIAQRDVAPILARTSALLRSDDELLDELAAAVDPTDARAIAAAPTPLARRAIRRWVIGTMFDASRNDPPDRSPHRSPHQPPHQPPGGQPAHPPDLATVERILAVARGDAARCDVHAGWRVERSQQRLQLFPPPSASR